jgi:2-dehydro-3-deoxyphosphogluconate aldolase/(4S)-4-hydroxy-2-oxoglutarate aldolase
MTKRETLQRIVDVGICPVIRVLSKEQAFAAADAVCDGGIPIVEIAMTVPGALHVIEQLAKARHNILVGAGTVLESETARHCIEAGAQFIVTPGFDAETVRLANSENLLIMAGALTPTEVITAWRAGADLVKVFPCGSVGGPKYIKALKGPLPQIPMVPTGGVNLRTAADFIRAGSAAVGIGGELVSIAALTAGRTAEITDTAKQYVRIIHEARAPENGAAAAVR